MWRPARIEDDGAIVEMSLSLYREDPGKVDVGADQIRRTLDTLRREPVRGKAVVLELDGRAAGYALLISFWSNELGGEVCEVDELFVAAEYRGRGWGSALFRAIDRGVLWPAPVLAIALGVTPANARARKLYERLGFEVAGTSMVRPGKPSDTDLTSMIRTYLHEAP